MKRTAPPSDGKPAKETAVSKTDSSNRPAPPAIGKRGSGELLFRNSLLLIR